MVFSTIGNREVLQLDLATFFLYILDWIDNIQVGPIFSVDLHQISVTTRRYNVKCILRQKKNCRWVIPGD